MNKESVNTVKKLSIIILFFSITSLMLISLLPWTTVEINEESKNVIYLDYEMMKKSDNENIVQITSTLSLINILLWAVIIIAFMSLLGVVLCLTKKFSILSNLLMFIGCFVCIIFIAILILNLLLFNDINSAEDVSLATFFGGISYGHILFFFNFLPFIISIFYSINSFTIALECYRNKKMKTIPTKNTSKKTKKEKREEKVFLDGNKEHDKIVVNKKMAPQDWNMKKEPEEETIVEKEETMDLVKDDSDLKLKQVETSYFENKKVNLDKKHGIKEEKEIPEASIKTEPEVKKIEEIEIKSTSEPEKKIEEPKEVKKDEPQEEIKKSEPEKMDQSFEKALFSAIEKRKKQQSGQTDFTKKEGVEEKEEKGNFEKGSYTVKCARCEHVFTAEIKKKGDKIKCPECGKEGSVK